MNPPSTSPFSVNAPHALSAIEKSALTGESVPSEKNTEPTPTDAGVDDRHGMAYSGNLVAAGRGVGVSPAPEPTPNWAASTR